MTPEEIVQALAEPFNACELELRTQPYTAVYVDARTFVRRLNQVLPLQWSFRTLPERVVDNNGNVTRDGVLVIHTPEGDREFFSTGTETADFGKGEPKAEKGADSDTFKRCCFRAGIGAYLYEIKNASGNSLTEQQVTQAARQAGYIGTIKPEHFGAMLPSRATAGDKSPAPAQARPQSAPTAANGATAQGSAVKPEAAREKFNRLAKALYGDSKDPKAEVDAFIQRLGVPYNAENLPLIIAKMEQLLSAQQPPSIMHGGAS